MLGKKDKPSLLRRGFKDFLYANALDDKHFSSNAGDATRGRGETKFRINKSERASARFRTKYGVEPGGGIQTTFEDGVRRFE